MSLNLPIALGLLLISPAIGAEASELSKSLEQSMASIKGARAFINTIACPDGKTPQIPARASGRGKKGGFADSYVLRCSNGLQGNVTWDPGQDSLPAVPPGFRLKTKEELEKFEIVGRVTEVSPGPGKKIWITTLVGTSYVSEDDGNEWKPGSLSIKGEFRVSIDRITFLNEQVGIATGYMDDKVYRTEDGGKTWTEIKVPDSGWIYDVFKAPDGKIWMGGSEGTIFQSVDHGRSWAKLKTPFNKDTRMHTIFMLSETEGVAAALDLDQLYHTKDNWKTWAKLATPYSSGLLKKPAKPSAKEGRDAKFAHQYELRKITPIDRLGMLGDKIVIVQGKKAFWANKGKVSWKPFEGIGLRDFLVDPESNRIFGIDQAGCVHVAGADLALKRAAKDCIRSTAADLKVHEGALIVFGRDEVIYRLQGDQLTASKPLPRN